MNRCLSIVNLCGVLVVAGLCLWQWQVNRQLHLNLARQQQEYAAQAARLAGATRDLEELRGRWQRLLEEMKSVRATLNSTREELRQVSAERDLWAAAAPEWERALEAREARLQEMAEAMRQLVLERDQMVKRYNELAAERNRWVRQFKEREATPQAEAEGKARPPSAP